MSKSNPLVGLIGYGDSDESDEEPSTPGGVEPALRASQPTVPGLAAQDAPSAGIHPAPIAHCPWSACYDEGSGFTYYWNQHTNAVTWEAPPEYLLALKLAQQQLNASGSAEVSAEEWQLYQQALAEKQNTQNKAKTSKPLRPVEKPMSKVKNGGKRKAGSDDETEKIELITSYHNSDSESNDETDSPVKSVIAPKPPKVLKATPKRPKAKSVVEYGPSLPANQNYTVPIGPELPPGMVVESKPKSPVNEVEIVSDSKEKEKKTVKAENEDSQDESTLFKRLKDKAKLLQKLGGEIPTELQKMIQDESGSRTASPKIVDDNKDTKLDIDDLLEEIEKTELPKVKSKKIDMFGEEATDSNISTPTSTPPRTEVKSLFPSSKTITEETVSLFPSAANIQENGIDPPKPEITEEKTEKKVTNVYLMDSSEPRENTNRKKLRIDNSVLPERKKTETPAYTTKYSQFIDGFSSERTGLGFKEDDESDKPKNTISYGNGLTFTKGEVLNEDKKDEELDDLVDLVDAKLKYLNQVQPCAVAPVQEMLIQLQTLSVAFRSGELTASYFERWTRLAARSLGALEASAAPPGWTCSFQRYLPLVLLTLTLIAI